MSQVQIEIPDSDRDLFVRQARREGMTLSAWLHAAGRARLERQQSGRPFASAEDALAFFRACDDLDGPEVEPDWGEHLRVINESRARSSSSAS